MQMTDKGRAEYTYNGFLKRVGTRHTSPDGTLEEPLKMESDYIKNMVEEYGDVPQEVITCE